MWEINLLRLSGLESISSYTLTLSVPKTFGPLLFAFPTPKTQSDSGTQRLLTYDKQTLLAGAPRIGFGELQLYKLALTYHLRNPGIGLGYTEIAFPPDILGYQKDIQTSFLPAPVSIRVDDDGNYLARYNLGPFEQKEVVWEGFLALFHPPRNFTNAKAEELPAELVQKYTKPQKYWETETVEIKSQFAQLVDPNLSVAQNLRRIYDFVTSNLSYDYQKLASGQLIRLGAQSALTQKDKAVCMEYTDLFIALARASGIPTREVNGYAYTADSTNRPLSLQLAQGDVLHAWPQAYFPNVGWVMIDPTWGSTSGSDYFSAFDLSHLSFVIKGAESEYPLPAGSYKTESGQKDVEVSFSSDTDILNINPNLEVEINFNPFAISPFPAEATIYVKNPSRVSAFAATLSITTNFLQPEEATINLGTIPPGAIVSKTVRLMPKDAFAGGNEKLQVTAAASSFEGAEISTAGSNSLSVYPLYLPVSTAFLLLVLAIFGWNAVHVGGKI